MTVNRRLGTPNKKDCFLLSKISNAWNCGVCEPVLRNAGGVPVVKMQRAVTMCWGGAMCHSFDCIRGNYPAVSKQHESCSTKHKPCISATTCRDDKKAPKFSLLIIITDSSFNTSLCKKIFHLRSKLIFHQFNTFPYHKLWQFSSVSILSVSKIQHWNAGVCSYTLISQVVSTHEFHAAE